MHFVIRLEQPGDENAIRELIARAFSASELGHHGEAELVDRLRSSCPEESCGDQPGPGRIAKSAGSFDLPIAVGILAGSGPFPKRVV